MPVPDQDTARISGSYAFDAPAEVVFGVLTDPDRTSRWLPRGMNTEPSDAGRVRVRAGARVHEYGVQVATDRLQVRWHSLDDSGVGGTARVEDSPAGGSVVHAEVAVPGRAPGDDQVRELLSETMEHLQRDVSDNFNAG
jgi:uncharacterized protein YndB with AHSA1/START domain